ncbi:MAG: prepilin-type N-terminal cleavage/methylation domain-containing protein [Planctomycetota bacterium]|nr:prepilin-type N-terminal cleavage/methylation domain-containing protein [Planctomycetota bacterium]
MKSLQKIFIRPRSQAPLGNATFRPRPRSQALLGNATFRSSASRPCCKIHRSGLSLLEVILALAILAMSVALLSQITKQSTDNGLMAQRLATAQMLCESKMSEVLAGAIPLTATPWTPITDSLRNGNWNYQIQTVTAQQKDMVGVRLSVTDQPDTTTENPELFFIVRWMIDPNLGLDTLPQSTDTGGGSTSSTGSGAAGGGIQ